MKIYKKHLMLGTAGFIALIIAAFVIVFALSRNDAADIPFTVPDYYALESFFFEGDVNEFRRDGYQWYKSIENQKGVYLIHTDYIDEELLKLWRANRIYDHLPQKAFWYFAASPSYLREIGVDVSTTDIESAGSGVRLYLVPDTMANSEWEAMSAYLAEDARKKAGESMIPTVFTRNKEVNIIRYTPKGEYFTWPSNTGEPLTDKAPVIYVCTAENMKYFESESLIATEIDSYIKFANEEILISNTDYSLMKKYSLNFSPSSEIYRNAVKRKWVDSGIEKVFK